MIRQDRVHALRQTHHTVASLMPLITAGLTVTGAIIAAIETRGGSSATEPEEEIGAASETAGATSSHTNTSTARRARPAPSAATSPPWPDACCWCCLAPRLSWPSPSPPPPPGVSARP